MFDTLCDVLASYGPQLALWLGWPGVVAGGLFGAAAFPHWRVPGVVAGATLGTLLWTACWLGVAMSLRMMGVAT